MCRHIGCQAVGETRLHVHPTACLGSHCVLTKGQFNLTGEEVQDSVLGNGMLGERLALSEPKQGCLENLIISQSFANDAVLGDVLDLRSQIRDKGIILVHKIVDKL